MNYIRKFKKNAKALSPVVASIILIAVTVAVSVVVAAWMGGMTIGLMGNTEQVSITNIQFTNGTTSTITALVQNSGGTGSAVIANAYVNGNSATAVSTPDPIPKNSAGSVALTVNAPLVDGSSYTIKLITSKGTQISSTATYSP